MWSVCRPTAYFRSEVSDTAAASPAMTEEVAATAIQASWCWQKVRTSPLSSHGVSLPLPSSELSLSTSGPIRHLALPRWCAANFIFASAAAALSETCRAAECKGHRAPHERPQGVDGGLLPALPAFLSFPTHLLPSSPRPRDTCLPSSGGVVVAFTASTAHLLRPPLTIIQR